MAILTELFIGSEEDARRYGPASASQFGAVRLSRLTNLEFEMLWAILDGAKWDVKKHSLRQVAATKEQWTFAFPSDYLSTLRQMKESAVSSAASTWASTPEVKTSPKDVEPVIRQLANLAQEAARKEKGLFLWMSL